MEQSDFDIQKEEDRNKNTKMPRIIQVGALYSLAVILMVLYPQDCKQHWVQSRGALSEVLLIMLPPLLFLILFKFDVKRC